MEDSVVFLLLTVSRAFWITFFFDSSFLGGDGAESDDDDDAGFFFCILFAWVRGRTKGVLDVLEDVEGASSFFPNTRLDGDSGGRDVVEGVVPVGRQLRAPVVKETTGPRRGALARLRSAESTFGGEERRGVGFSRLSFGVSLGEDFFEGDGTPHASLRRRRIGEAV